MFGDANKYERFMGRWSRLLARPFLDFANVADSGEFLDVGSGTGALAFTLAERKPRVQVGGIDPSKEYVDYAASKNPSRDRVRFEVGDAQELRFGDGSFDGSLSLLVFNFIPDPLKALKELRRVTKAEGRIAAAVWDYGEGMKMLRTFWDSVVHLDPKADKLDERHMRLCRAGELSELWRQGGLKDIEEKPIEIPMHFESFADYWDPFLLGQGPAGAYVKSLDHLHVDALRAEVKKQISPASEKAPFTLSARVWAVRGTVPR
ncbi:MAG TPA: class I SAM-dependent methyltransferase [Bryobacteraceae bacterium]|nr:class I SAM-dependent methyltransferase [Bryobacteraceae bacterium]